tara:strand:- start:7489 stop:8472 length:984 start_codon:yes stop_codon:yes gene_type:complete
MSITSRFTDAIAKANSIVISTHIHPDADGIGSEIALCMALRQLGKDTYCVNEEPLLDRYHYLDPESVVFGLADWKKRPVKTVDLLIVVDTNSLSRVGSGVEKFGASAKEVLFVDHHPCPREIMAIHCIDTSVSATGELAGTLIEAMGAKFTPQIALALYTSILIDTSSFRYPTVSANTHRLIAKLMDSGVEPPQAYNLINGTKKTSFIRLLGQVLGSVESTKDESIAWIAMTDDQLEEYGVDIEDTHGFINHLLILDNIKVACMFRQIGHQVKISFRSADAQVDVGVIAQALGGGGHDHSAATIQEGHLHDILPATITKISLMLKKD